MTKGTRKGVSPHPRARARRSVIQAYYQWQLASQPVADIIREFESDRSELKKADIEYFRDVLAGMTACTGELDEILSSVLDRPPAELDPIERAVLHLGSYELVHRPELPWRVVINEAVELAKMFGAEQSHKYINGVLDKLAHRFRAAEMADAS